MSDFAFRIIADIKNYQAEIAKTPGMTDRAAAAAAQRLVFQLEKGGREAGQRAGAAFTKAMDGSVRAGGINLANQLSDVASQLSTGTSPLTILVQQGPQAAGALGMMGSAGVLAAGALAGVTAAVGLGVVAWRTYYEELDEAERVAGLVTEAHRELAPLLDATREATVRTSVATGEMSALMGDLESNSLRALRAWGAATDETRAKVRELRIEQDGALASFAETFEAPAGTLLGALVAKTVDAFTDSTSELAAQEAALSAEVGQSIIVLDQNVDVTERGIIATNEAAEAAKRRREAEAALRAEMARRRREMEADFEDAGREVERQDAVTSAILRGQATARASYVSRLDGERAVLAALGDQIGALNAEEAVAQRNARYDEERAAIALAYEDARVQAVAKAEEEIAEIKAKAAEKEAAEAEKRRKAELDAQRQYANAVQSVVTTSLDTVTDLTGQAYNTRASAARRLQSELESGEGKLTAAQKRYIEQQIQAHKRAAMTAFIVSKAAGVASATINALIAVSEASTLPYPMNIAASAEAAIRGAANVAAIASTPPPSFHRGTLSAQSRRRDEMIAVLEPGEAVVEKNAARDPANQTAIARMNGGRATGGGDVIVVDRYDGRAFSRSIRDQVRRPGALHTALAARTPHYGHR